MFRKSGTERDGMCFRMLFSRACARAEESGRPDMRRAMQRRE